MTIQTLDTLPLSNSFARLPADFYSRVETTPFQKPARLLHFNSAAAALLDLDTQVQYQDDFLAVFSGKRRLPGGEPLAMLYAGHQFGHYVPQLGDGRAILLGETTNRRGERWEIQLKGSGITPYSRDGDGRAVLRSTLREYLCSEAMHGLNIPTTRALCITGSDDEVYRERIETGAMLARLAPSHVRFGSFEVFFYREQTEQIRILADFVVTNHYPHLQDAANRYCALLQEVVERTAHLMAQWQAVGFAHGVMNTDNMSILGLTLDYGPFGFMEAYDPGFVCNHSDHHGRYAFDQQPQIGLWNLTCLAQALTPLIDIDAARAALEEYESLFKRHYQRLMANKLGFADCDKASRELVADLLQQMQQSAVDYTNLFRALGDVTCTNRDRIPSLRDRFVDRERFDRWLNDYRAQLQAQGQADRQRRTQMLRVNPGYVLRNYLAQQAIEQAETNADYSEVERLMKLLRSPFDEHPGFTEYAEPAPAWAAGIQVSCSS